MSEPIQKSRDTRFAIMSVAVGPNALGVEYAERGQAVGLTPPLELHDYLHSKASKATQLPDELIVRWRDLLGDTELFLEGAYDAWEATTEALYARKTAVIKAAKDLDAIATQHATIESDLIVKRDEVTQLAAHADAMTQAVTDRTEEFQTLTAKVGELRAQHEEFASKFQAHVTDATAKSAELQSAIAAGRQEAQQIADLLDRLKEAHGQLLEAVTVKSAEHDELSAKVDAARAAAEAVSP